MDFEIFKRDYAQARTFINPDAIPDKLKQHPFWNVWKYEYDAERPKPLKTPYNVNANPRKRGSSTDTTTFDIFNKATAVYEGDTFYSGLGVGIFGNLCGIDIDNCLDKSGMPSELAQDFINTMKSYTEISPSGKGIRIFAFINDTFDKERYEAKYKKKNDAIGLEIYIGDTTGRYLTVTGNIGDADEPTDIADRTAEVMQMLDKYMKKEKNNNSPTAEQKQLAIIPTVERVGSRTVSGYYPENFLKTVADVLEHAMNAKNSDKFNRLFKGDISGYESHSQADQAFCNLLAFYSGCDENLMDATFRESGLIRKKWDEKHKGNQTYGEMTIETAIASCTKVYNPQQYADAHNSSKTNNADLPDWVVKTKHGFKVHTARLAKQIQDNSKYFFVRDGDMEFIRCFWYDENKGIYRFTNISDIESKIKRTIGNFDESLLKTPDIREISSLITIPDCCLSESAVNADEKLICFRNGVLNWETGEFFKLSSDFRITIQIDADYVPDKVYSLDDAPTFKKYLNDLTESNEEKKKILLEFAGACLSNVHGYKYKKSLFLIGETDSGKSQYIKLICELLGIGNCAEVAFKKIDDRFQTATTYGKRLIFSADTTFDRTKTNDNFMSFTGGDYMSIEYKGQMPFNAIYKGLLLFSSNKMPVWSGNDTTAAYNRMICIRCDNSIPKERQDKQLLEKMLQERNVIAYLAIEAFKKTVKHGYQFSVPTESDTFIAEVKRYNNPVIDFFENCCERFDDAEQNIKHCYKKSDMYQLFKDWYTQNISEYSCKGTKEFKAAIMSHLKVKNEKEIIRKLNGINYYKFVPTIETLNEFREGHTSVSE